MKQKNDTEKPTSKKSKNLLVKYNRSIAKNNFGITALKTGVSTIGASVGAGLGATAGTLSPFIGVLMIGLGQYIGDKSGLLSLAGAATLGYGIAKSQENRVSESTMKERLINFKDDWFNAFYIDKIIKSEESSEEGVSGFAAIDTSKMDHFSERLKESAIQFQMRQVEDELEEDEIALSETHFFNQEDTLEDLDENDYSIIEDEQIDFSSF